MKTLQYSTRHEKGSTSETGISSYAILPYESPCYEATWKQSPYSSSGEFTGEILCCEFPAPITQ